MALTRVSFEVAKAIKEAGYPQIGQRYQYGYEGNLVDLLREGGICYGPVAPTYFEVRLWLWREKKIAISCLYEDTYNYWFTNISAENDKSLILWKYSSGECNDPEEAIIAAIEYLVEHKLLK